MKKALKLLIVCLLIACASGITVPAPALAVHVKGYYRKDGTYVHAHSRRRPRRRNRRRRFAVSFTQQIRNRTEFVNTQK